MKGYDILKKAVLRLGYEDLKGELLFERGFEAINQICTDLKLNEVSSLSDEISASNQVIDCICCGVAMMLSFSQGDGEMNPIFTSLYNAKRALVLSNIENISDVMPKIESGDNI